MTRNPTTVGELGEESDRDESVFRLLVESVRDYGIFMLEPDGRIATWNAGAERIKGYRAEEIIGRHFSTFYPPEDVAAGKPAWELEGAAAAGRFEDEGWRVRKDGTLFWANVVITALRNPTGGLVGFAKVTRDLTERRRGEEALRHANVELAATTYAIAHDLRSPLRALDGYSLLLLEEHGDRLDQDGRAHLGRIRAGAQRMGQLLDGLLALARIGRGDISWQPVDLSALAQTAIDDLQRFEPERQIDTHVARGVRANGDPRLLSVVLQNLIGNAWKFTRHHARPRISFEVERGPGGPMYVVRDNGVGFAPEHAGQLFRPFHRLHAEAGFEGTGIGLATVRRIVERHGGRVWTDALPDRGSSFFFTLSETAPEPREERGNND